MVLLDHLLGLFFAQDNDLARKEAFAVATSAAACCFVAAVFGFVRIATVKIAVVSVSVVIVAVSDSAMIVVSDSAMTAVASRDGTNAVASGF